MSMVEPAGGSRLAELREQLRKVMDPELDESVLELGFITDLCVSGDGHVSIRWHLPTFWCAVNFAYLMADDMRRRIGELRWVQGIELRLVDHMAADEINRGVAARQSFTEIFGSAADPDLDALRQVFLVKAFQRRQEKLLRHLLAAGHPVADLVDMTVTVLRDLALDEEGADLRAGYLERRADLAAITPHLAPTARAFVDADGRCLPQDQWRSYLRRLTLVSLNVDINASVCRSLLATRSSIGQPTALTPGDVAFSLPPLTDR